MAVDPWSNDACRGYVIWTMENSGFKPKEITQAVTELYTAFDFQTLKKWPGIIIIVLFYFGSSCPEVLLLPISNFIYRISLKLHMI